MQLFAMVSLLKTENSRWVIPIGHIKKASIDTTSCFLTNIKIAIVYLLLIFLDIKQFKK